MATAITATFECKGTQSIKEATDTTPEQWQVTLAPIGTTATIAPKTNPLLLTTSDATVVSQFIAGQSYTLTITPTP